VLEQTAYLVTWSSPAKRTGHPNHCPLLTLTGTCSTDASCLMDTADLTVWLSSWQEAFGILLELNVRSL